MFELETNPQFLEALEVASLARNMVQVYIPRVVAGWLSNVIRVLGYENRRSSDPDLQGVWGRSDACQAECDR